MTTRKELKRQFESSRASAVPPRVAVGTERSMELALSGDLDSFAEWIEANQDLINKKEETHGNVPLHVACSKGNMPLINLLLRKGANVNLQDIYGNAPIMYAIDKGKIEVMRVLINNGADVNRADYRGNTPLHNAAVTNNFDAVSMLLRSGADPDALDFNNEKASQKTRNFMIREAIEEASQKKKEGNDAGVKNIVNWMGFGIGLGVGLGMAMARQQQIFMEKAAAEEAARKAAADEALRKRREEAEALMAKSRGEKKKREPQKALL